MRILLHEWRRGKKKCSFSTHPIVLPLAPCYPFPRMIITWNGEGSFTIVAKPAQSDVTVVLNPFSVPTRIKPQAASLVVSSHDDKDANAFSLVSPEHPEEGKKVFPVTHAGEYEVQGVFVHGVHAAKKDGSPHTIYRITAEGIRVGYLGALDRNVTTAELEQLGSVDVLLIALGEGRMSPTLAPEVIHAVDPLIVLPAYEGGALALGCPTEEVAKCKISKSQLVGVEEMKQVVLQKV